MKKIISTEKAPKAVGPYSQAVLQDGVLYASGQLPIIPENGEMPQGIEAQTEQSLKNLGVVLKEAGMDFSNVVKVTVLLADIKDFAPMNAVYAKFFAENAPARMCYQVAAIPKGAMVEIDVIAVQ